MSVTLLKIGNLIDPSRLNSSKFESVVPIEYIISWLREWTPSRDLGTISEKITGIGNKVLCLKSGTASGKSTVLPLYLFQNFFNNKNIIILEPKRANVVSIPFDIIQFDKNLKMGFNIGYQTSTNSDPPIRGLLFMTVAILLQHFKTMSDEELIDRYSFIIIDECHDRTIYQDLLLYLIKKFLQRNYLNSKCPFIICMSATFDEQKFLKYFECKNYFEVKGMSYPIENHFLSGTASNYINRSIDTIKEILSKPTDKSTRDILVFVSGFRDAEMLMQKLEKEGIESYYISGESDTKSKEYKELFLPSKERRIIIGTNAVETGVTIPSIGNVIDIGLSRVIEFVPIGIELDVLKPITQSSVRQRKGRAGRKDIGDFYPIYTEDTYNSMQIDRYPDILISDITSEVLDILINLNGIANLEISNMKVDEYGNLISDKKKSDNLWEELKNINMLDIPSFDSLNYSTNILYRLGYITNSLGITRIGYLASKIRKLPIYYTRLILAGYVYNCSIETLIWMTLISVNGSLFTDRDGTKSFFGKDYTKEQMIIADDMIEGAMICQSLFTSEYNKIEKKGVSLQKFLGILSQRDEIISDLFKIGLDPFYNSQKSLDTSWLNVGKEELLFHEVCNIKKCIYDAFRHNLIVENKFLGFPEKQVSFRSKLISPILADENPKYVLTNKISIRLNKKTGIYQLFSDLISVLDGFIDTEI